MKNLDHLPHRTSPKNNFEPCSPIAIAVHITIKIAFRFRDENMCLHLLLIT